MSLPRRCWLAGAMLGLGYLVAAGGESPDVTTMDSTEPLTVWYLGHCGFAVRVGHRLLVFDYLSDRGTPAEDPDAGGLEDGVLQAEDLQGLDVYVFVTHPHSDHYDPGILKWAEEADRIHYLFGWQPDVQTPHHDLAGPRAILDLDGMKVFTINSHHSGVPEVAYLVQVDGFWVYHNGDYRQDYLRDFQYLATLTDRMDLVFHVGLTNETLQYTQQAFYLLEHFRPAAFFPMHFGGNEGEMEEFVEMVGERRYDTFLPLPQRRGDRWEIGSPGEGSVRPQY